MRELLFDANILLYQKYYNRAEYKTIYHHPEYLSAEEAAESYPLMLYLYEDNEDFVILPSIKRRINDISMFNNIQQEYYDLKTPHEYSGVIASRNDGILIRNFYCALDKYARLNNIIFSFIRFNPYTHEQELTETYMLSDCVEQIVIDCKKGEPIDQMSSSAKRNMKIAQKQLMVCKEVEKSNCNQTAFKKMYEEAMNKLNASSFFYFSEEYFRRLFVSDITRLFFVYNDKRQVVAATIILVDDINKIAYYHLSCRNRACEIKGIMELLIGGFSEQLKQEGFEKIHLGGGATQTLRNFKERFSNDRVDYYTGYEIFNDEMYCKLCKTFTNIYPDKIDEKFVPLYRCLE